MQIRLPQPDGTLNSISLKARPMRPHGKPEAYDRTVYAAAHVVFDPLATVEPWNGSPIVDWDRTLAFREHLWSLGFKIAEAMDTAQRGMGVDWPVAHELIRRSLRHAKTVPGADLACGAGTDQLEAGPEVTLAQVEAAYREQIGVVEAEGGRVILMASRALARCARGPDDYLALYGRLLRDVSQPVVLHWLGEMFDPALRGYWGPPTSSARWRPLPRSSATTRRRWKASRCRRSTRRGSWRCGRGCPRTSKMYTGDDFNYAELIAGDGRGHSHGLLGIFDPIAPVAAVALALAAARTGQFRKLLDPTVALSREISRAPTRHYKAGVVFIARLNGHQDHFCLAGGVQSARGAVHYARVFELADACGVFSDPELAMLRMKCYLSVACGVDA